MNHWGGDPLTCSPGTGEEGGPEGEGPDVSQGGGRGRVIGREIQGRLSSEGAAG